MNTHASLTPAEQKQHGKIIDYAKKDGRTVATAGASLVIFFVLAYLLSWLITVPLALKAHGVNVPLPFALHYVAGYGPLLAALIASWRGGGFSSVAAFLRRRFRRPAAPFWWLVAIAPLFAYALVSAVLWFLGNNAPTLDPLGQLNFLPNLGVAALPFWIFTFGLGEESGWRGYALPRLQQRYGPLRASLLLWILWTLWHLPLFFYTYDTTALPGVIIGLLAGTLVFTWLFNRSGGSVLVVALWHGAFNYTTACIACGPAPATAAISALVMVWAVLLLPLYFFRSKQAARGA